MLEDAGGVTCWLMSNLCIGVKKQKADARIGFQRDG